eukprot:s1425_g14.t1
MGKCRCTIESPWSSLYGIGSMLYLAGSLCYTFAAVFPEVPAILHAGNMTFVLGSIIFTFDAMYVRGEEHHSAKAADGGDAKLRSGKMHELYKYKELDQDPNMGMEEGHLQLQLDNLKSENFNSAAFNGRNLPASST